MAVLHHHYAENDGHRELLKQANVKSAMFGKLHLARPDNHTAALGLTGLTLLVSGII
jgi:hypothetical protein